MKESKIAKYEYLFKYYRIIIYSILLYKMFYNAYKFGLIILFENYLNYSRRKAILNLIYILTWLKIRETYLSNNERLQLNILWRNMNITVFRYYY